MAIVIFHHCGDIFNHFSKGLLYFNHNGGIESKFFFSCKYETAFAFRQQTVLPKNSIFNAFGQVWCLLRESWTLTLAKVNEVGSAADVVLGCFRDLLDESALDSLSNVCRCATLFITGVFIGLTKLSKRNFNPFQVKRISISYQSGKKVSRLHNERCQQLCFSFVSEFLWIAHDVLVLVYLMIDSQAWIWLMKLKKFG